MELRKESCQGIRTVNHAKKYMGLCEGLKRLKTPKEGIHE
jgi:hypothetical protein